MKHNLGENFVDQQKHFRAGVSRVSTRVCLIACVCALHCRADNGGDEAESGTGERAPGERGEETDGGGEAASGGRDQEETVVRQLPERGHFLLLLEHQLLRLPVSASPLARAHEVLHSVR